MSNLRITIWHEYRHEKKNPKVAAVYPQGMHMQLAKALAPLGSFDIRTATLDEPSHGLTDDVLNTTDVLVWWGHTAHGEVQDDIVRKVHQRILKGMGILVLHSGHFSKIFKALMGTTCDLKWRESNDREILWVTAPGHPIVAGIADHFIIPAEEMYGEHFGIPEPEETVLISSFTGGEVFRSCVTYRRGAGKVVYFRPGHETYPTYYQKEVLHVIANSLRWAAPVPDTQPVTYSNHQPLP